jgi:hypothetical protein
MVISWKQWKLTTISTLEEYGHVIIWWKNNIICHPQTLMLIVDVVGNNHLYEVQHLLQSNSLVLAFRMILISNAHNVNNLKHL